VFDRKTWVPTSDPNGISHGTLKIEGETRSELDGGTGGGRLAAPRR